MRTLKLNDFERGWIIGNFSPSLYTSEDIEVGLLHLEKGHKGDGHYHKETTEYNFIVNGAALIEGRVLYSGECFVYEKGERSNVEYILDTDILCIRLPSLKGDKYY